MVPLVRQVGDGLLGAGPAGGAGVDGGDPVPDGGDGVDGPAGQDGAGQVDRPGGGGRVVGFVQGAGGLVEIAHHVHEVDQCRDRDAPSAGLLGDLVDLLVVAVDQRDPGPGVGGVPPVGLVDHGADHGGMSSVTLALTQVPVAAAAGRRLPRRREAVAGGMSAGVRVTGVTSLTATTSAIRFRPWPGWSDSPAGPAAARAAAAAVAGRSASGSITIPLPSACSINTLPGHGPARRAA